jgi:hypothetical protein
LRCTPAAAFNDNSWVSIQPAVPSYQTLLLLFFSSIGDQWLFEAGQSSLFIFIR